MIDKPIIKYPILGRKYYPNTDQFAYLVIVNGEREWHTEETLKAWGYRVVAEQFWVEEVKHQ